MSTTTADIETEHLVDLLLLAAERMFNAPDHPDAIILCSLMNIVSKSENVKDPVWLQETTRALHIALGVN